jgi:hypothetical protein
MPFRMKKEVRNYFDAHAFPINKYVIMQTSNQKASGRKSDTLIRFEKQGGFAGN